MSTNGNREWRRATVGAVALTIATTACTGLLGARPREAPAPVDVPTITEPELPAPPVLPEPEAVASDSARLSRLRRIALVWHALRIHHPAASADPAGWDAATVRHLPALRAADEAALPAALDGWLAVLRDPQLSAMTAAPARSAERRAELSRSADSVVTLRIGGTPTADDTALIRRAVQTVAPRWVIDLRNSNASELSRMLSAMGLPAALAARGTHTVLLSTRYAERGMTHSESFTTLAGSATTPPRVAMIANGSTLMPEALLPLLATGHATLIAEEQAPRLPIEIVSLPIEGSVRVPVRTMELVTREGGVFRADTTVAAPTATDTDPAMRAALAWLRSSRTAATARRTATPLPRYATDVPFDAPYPAMGARIMAAFRVWSVMRAEHAHREGYEDDIDARLESTIAAVERAGSASAFAAALIDQVASFDDSGVSLFGESVELARGASAAPFRARVVEGRAIVTEITGDNVPGLSVGTEIVAVDGYPFTAWLETRRRWVSASNQWTRTRDIARDLPRGAAGALLLRVRDATGPERSIAVPRVPTTPATPRPTRTTADARRIGEIAYIDGERWSAPVDSLDRLLDRSAALIVDLRGSVRTPWGNGALVERVFREPAFILAQETRTTMLGCLEEYHRDALIRCDVSRLTSASELRPDVRNAYRGRLVVLVDERTQGAAEQFAMALERGANAALVGSATVGAPADNERVALPGGLTLEYPRHEVRRGDGSRTHRVGLTPLLDVRPTVRGIRAGQDEVLDRAIAWLQAQDAPRRRR